MPDGTDDRAERGIGGAETGRIAGEDPEVIAHFHGDEQHSHGHHHGDRAWAKSAGGSTRHGQLVVEFLDQLSPKVGTDPHVLAGLATAYIHHVLPLVV